MDQSLPPTPPSSRGEGEVSKQSAVLPAPPPPPPPPPPPKRQPQSSGPAGPISMPPPMPPGAFDFVGKIGKTRYLQSITKANLIREAFQPCHMFFYGSLMDSEVIQTILALPDVPTTVPAIIFGFQIKMWGIYPALIPSKSGKVVGTVWEVTSEDQFERLAAYETAAYDWVKCDAVLEDGSVLTGCRTFCWAGAPDSNELEDGNFDLARYRKYFKPSVTRRRSPVS